MTVAKYVAPNYTDVAQTAAIYKGYIDGGMSVLHAVAGDFAPHAQDTPNMTVRCDAGKIIKSDGTLTEQAAQNTATIVAPVTNPRIDRVVIDASTGAVSVITGAEAASPTAPSITAGKLPVAQIALTTSTTAITNSIITDERTHVADINSALTLFLATVNAWTKQQYFAKAALTDGVNIAWNLDNAQTAAVTLAGNRTLDNPTNMKDGAHYTLKVVQDATGSRTLAYGSAYKWPSGVAPTLTTTASAVDLLTFWSDGTYMYGAAVKDLR